MPQMFPLNWSILFIMLILFILITSSIIFFLLFNFYLPQPHLSKTSDINTTWMW